MLFVLWLTASDYPFGIFWLLCCLSFDLQLLITPVVSFDYYVVCPLTYSFWLPFWDLLTIMLSVLWLTASDYPFGIFWPLYCLFFVDDTKEVIRISKSTTNWQYNGQKIPKGQSESVNRRRTNNGQKKPKGQSKSVNQRRTWLPLWYLLAIVLSVLRRFTDSAYTFGIFWPLYFLFLIDWLILITIWHLLANVLQRGNQNQ
jgi:hypothetical protein